MSGTAIQDPPAPSTAPVNFGDSVVLFDTKSGMFFGKPQPAGSILGPPPQCPPACGCLISSTPNPNEALVFTVSDASGAVITPGTNSSFVNYTSSISLLVGPYSLSFKNPATNGAYVSMQEVSPITVQNQFVLNPVFANTGPIKATSLSQFGAANTLCSGLCNAFTLTSITDTAAPPKYPAGFLTNSSNLCNNVWAWGSSILGNNDVGGGPGPMPSPNGKVTTSVFQMFLVSQICGSNANCSVGNACWSNKCYPIPSLSDSLMNQVCNYDPTVPNNNMNDQACVTFCNGQTVAGTNSYRSSCDTAMLGYCPAAYPDYQSNQPLIPSPCTCTLAQLNSDQYPECFTSGCFVNSPLNYYQSTQQTTLNQNGCGSACEVVFNCQNAGSCTVDNSQFCLVCGNQPNIGASCQSGGGGNTPSDWSKFKTWLKANPWVWAAVGAVVFLVLSIIVIMATKKPTK